MVEGGECGLESVWESLFWLAPERLSPIAEKVHIEEIEGLIIPPDADIPAISDIVVNLIDVQRTDTGFQFTWQNCNPTEFALTTHIGTPPVIGEDGIIYGIYETMDLAPVPPDSRG
jgi:hypothetical protein